MSARRTGGGERWPERADLQLAAGLTSADVERWVPTASMLIPFAAACLGKLVAAAVLGTTALRFALTGLYQLTTDSGLEQAAGIVGLVLLAIALYAAFALTLEDARGEAALPVGRRLNRLGTAAVAC